MRNDPYAQFLRRYRPDEAFGELVGVGQIPAWVESTGGFAAFMSSVARRSFDAGLLRFLPTRGEPSLDDANGPAGWLEAWPDVQERLWVFAYDWLGRLYGFDRVRTTDGSSTVSRLDIGVGEILEADVPFDDFVNDLLVGQGDDVLARDYFQEWLGEGGRPLRPTECVGFKVPLFLGGADEVANLELTSIRVYLALSGQLFAQASKHPLGGAIPGVSLTND